MLLFWHLGQRSWEVISRKACSWASSLNCRIDGGPRLAGQHQRQQDDYYTSHQPALRLY